MSSHAPENDGLQGSPQRRSTHRADIDGLRAVAVLSVVLFHAGVEQLSGGFVGVDIFFVISGYLITGIIAREMTDGRFSIVAFYERRVRRIFPALFVMFAVVAAIAYAILLPDALVQLGKSLISATLFLSNVFFSSGGDYFDGPSELKPLLHTWSLAVEEQFYIVFPLYLYVAFRLFRGRVRTLTVVLAAGSLALSVWGVSAHREAAFFLAPARADELLIGALVALGAFPRVTRQRWRDGLSLLGLLMIGWSVIGFSNDTPFPGFSALVPCVGTALVIHAGSEHETIAGRVLGTRPFVLVGLISYSLYLWHWPLLAFARYRAIRELRTAEIWAVVLMAVVASFISWRFVEQPFRGRDALLRRWPLFVLAGSGSAIFLAFGYWIMRSGGRPERIGTERVALEGLGKRNERTCVEHASAKNIAADSCVIGSAQADTVHFALWGDSHAFVSAPVVDAVAKERGAAGLFFAELGCPLILGVRKHELGHDARDSDSCAKLSERAFQAITTNPTIQRVILIARWSYYVSGEGYGMDRFHRIAISAKGESRLLAPREIEALASETIRALIAAGKTVYMIETVPEFSFHPDAMARMLWYGESIQALDEPRTAVELRSASVRNIAATFAGDAHFRFVPTHDLFCSDLVCRFHDGRSVFYADNNHIGALANARIATRIAAAFQD
ncbi:MAG TPA: acyltransferase family protein [Polyangiaceae bacterium]|nr:acyltransferase family protein [Polyangiaceae bacterium]